MIKYYQHNNTLYVYSAEYAVPEEMVPLTNEGFLTLKDTMPVDRSGIPNSLTMRQARLVLSAYKLLPSIEVNLSSMPEAFQIEWNYASSIDRNSPVLALMASMLNLNDVLLDNMFLMGGSL